jgi:hypothetical protein
VWSRLIVCLPKKLTIAAYLITLALTLPVVRG